MRKHKLTNSELYEIIKSRKHREKYAPVFKKQRLERMSADAEMAKQTNNARRQLFRDLLGIE